MTKMHWMFYEATAFNQVNSITRVGNVDMSSMFLDASAFNQDIGNWNTSQNEYQCFVEHLRSTNTLGIRQLGTQRK